MLVDPETGELRAVSQEAAAAGEKDSQRDVDQELYLQQLEVATSPCQDMKSLLGDLKSARRAAGESARTANVAAVAMPTPVMPDPREQLTPNARYQRISETYGELARQALACAMHVHVEVAGDEEAVVALDRIRHWLPILLAISANSPFWEGRDTGFASWRSQTWGRWPSSGSNDPFQSLCTYESVAEKVIDWGGALDRGMLYYDARVAQNYPTVEIRVADVCADPREATLIAALCRALVETVVRDDHADSASVPWRTDLLRVAHWRAAKVGVTDKLVHPQRQRLVPVTEAFEALLGYVAPALEELGDLGLVQSSLEALTTEGNGAVRQRRAHETHGTLQAVVDDMRARTEASWQ